MVYAARYRENRDVADVIVGTFFINFIPYFVLIVGSTHQYIASNIFVNLGIHIESTSGDVSVINPLG